LAPFTKKEIIRFIESFLYKKRDGNHGAAYNIYNKDRVQLNIRPILIPRDKKNYFGDKAIKLLSDSFGIDQQFLKEPLNGERTAEEYEKDILSRSSKNK